jgi:hypothetical protein
MFEFEFGIVLFCFSFILVSFEESWQDLVFLIGAIVKLVWFGKPMLKMVHFSELHKIGLLFLI